MGHAKRPEKVKLIAGLLSGDTGMFARVKKLLEKTYGPVDFESSVLDFTHTEYYKDEMGKDLKKIFYGFKKMVGLDNIYKVKERTNSIETRLSKNGRRRINIDPGYLNLSKVVLFTTKDYAHRIHLHGGIYGEVTLHYRNRSFNPWPWTYPDFRTEEYIKIFDAIREIYKNKTAGS